MNQPFLTLGTYTINSSHITHINWEGRVVSQPQICVYFVGGGVLYLEPDSPEAKALRSYFDSSLTSGEFVPTTKKSKKHA